MNNLGKAENILFKRFFILCLIRLKQLTDKPSCRDRLLSDQKDNYSNPISTLVQLAQIFVILFF